MSSAVDEMFFSLFVLSIFSPAYCDIIIDSNGGFKNVIVGIDPSVPAENLESIILKLEALFQNASRFLYFATREQTFFKEVTFAVPKQLRSALPDRKWASGWKEFSHPDVLLTSADVFNVPYALQNGGCGKSGLRIHLPQKYVSERFATVAAARALVQEWAKFRYGVFDESGFEGDSVYPACYTVPGTNTVRVTDCASGQAEYETGDLTSSCHAKPVSGINDHILSSLMTKMDFPKLSHFCDDENYPHNSNVPSKQNSLCEYQNVWKIISRHTDFRFKWIRNQASLFQTSFKYIVESTMRLVVVVDTSSAMAVSDRLDIVRNAFSYFALYNLPENAMVGLINLRKLSDGGPTLVTVRYPTDADTLVDAFPEGDVSTRDVCVDCGIERALQALRLKSDEKVEGTIVVIAANDVSSAIYPRLEKALKDNEVVLNVLFFSRRLQEVNNLQKLAKVSKGRFFHLADNPFSLNIAYEAFRSVNLDVTSVKNVLVDQKNFVTDECRSCQFTFVSDASMTGLQVVLTWPDFTARPVVKDRTELSDGNQDFAPGHSSFSYKIKVPAYIFTIRDPSVGRWTLKFERKSDYNKTLVVIVRAWSTQNQHINMNSWVEQDLPVVHPDRPPTRLFSELKRGHFPVTHSVAVTASLRHATTGEETNVQLQDVGGGDPDITGRDGIFSKYLVETRRKGYYTVTMTAMSNAPIVETSIEDLTTEHQCCGSSFPAESSHPTGPFKRVVHLGTIYIPEDSVEFPPRRVNDLRVTSLITLRNSPRLGYRLQWTSPGSNYDSDPVMGYQLRVFSNQEEARTAFETTYVMLVGDFDVHGEMLSKRKSSTPGSLQTAVIELKNLKDGTYFLALRAIGSDGGLSKISNVVEVWYNAPVTPTGWTSLETTSSNLSGNETVSESPSALGFTLGITLGLVFLFIVVAIFVCRYLALRRHQEQQPPKLTFLPDVTQKTESCDPLCRELSPVGSWPAESLLTHYESLKKHKDSIASEGSTALPKDTTDTLSTSSSKYSYPQPQNISVYDQVYFRREDMPIASPFNPVYTSSLRQLPLDYSPSPLCYSTASLPLHSTLNSRRLATDV